MMSKISGPEAAKMLDECSRALVGHEPYVQGAVLADLLAMWLADHTVVGDRKATDLLRENLLKEHVQAVRALVPVNEQRMIEKLMRVAAQFGKDN
jgi:hypothetical protein